MTPTCHEGFGIWKEALVPLAPPPAAAILALVPQVAEVQLSFQTFSGMYFNADAKVPGLLVELQ